MKKQGFSLIELMIVVAIVGILAAIAIPSFMNYILKAKSAERSTITNGIFNGESLYNVANDSFINVGSGGDGTKYTPVSTSLLGDDIQSTTISRWEIDGQNIGYLPEKGQYSSAKANPAGVSMQNRMRIYVAQDLDDDNSIAYLQITMLKDATTRDAYIGGNTRWGDKW